METEHEEEEKDIMKVEQDVIKQRKISWTFKSVTQQIGYLEDGYLEDPSLSLKKKNSYLS